MKWLLVKARLALPVAKVEGGNEAQVDVVPRPQVVWALPPATIRSPTIPLDVTKDDSPTKLSKTPIVDGLDPLYNC